VFRVLPYCTFTVKNDARDFGTSRPTEGLVSADDDRAELERLRKENEALKASLSRGTRLKVSSKGGVSVYGLQRMPVTLYKGQWLRLLDMADEIRVFIREHINELSEKSDSAGGKGETD
jgi:hypothetical protein